ncbi:MAG TPA: hemerythrin domain-containing protein [Trebonia sp.]|jgi:hypothetical protein|nr:hemerythrin domain-containing protein [Trebonia sp.]
MKSGREGSRPPADDAVTVLSRQHGEITALTRAVRNDARPGGGAKGPELRRALARISDLRRCFIAHERAKQLYLWPLLRGAWPDGKAIGKAAWRRKQHAEERFEKLHWLSERDPRASEVLDQVLAAIEEHISVEERLLGRMRRTLPEDVLAQTGAKLASRGFLVPTRPHPQLPGQPWAGALLGPVAGLADRVVEAFSFGPSGA